jgi:pSer/pThr/pTyr-binding forkhead associated (FHA) protein
MLAAIGGFIGWMIIEPFARQYDSNSALRMPDGIQLLIGAIIGAFVGAGIAVATALSGVSPRDALKSMIFGVAIGAVGGMTGFRIGNFFYAPFAAFAQSTKVDLNGPPSFIGFVADLIGRSIGWGLMGLFLGLGPGVATLSNKKMVNGAVGGLLGGLAGGFVFGILNAPGMGIPGLLCRMIGFTATGAAIGLLIGFIEEFTKRAWLIHLKGRNEGKEFQIFKPDTVVGRDELIDIPVFGDPDVELRHFVIKADQSKHLLMDCGTTSGTMVNGTKVQQQVLRDGDIIQIGFTKFAYHDKATRSSTPRPQSFTGGPAIPTNPNVCPFCGSVKDAQGNCQCSVGAGAGGQGSGAGNQTVVQPAQPLTGPAVTQQTVPFNAAPSGQGRLVAIAGPYSGQSYNLPMAGELTIGRQSDRSIPLANDNTVSRQHARIANEGGQFVVYDMGSANGTYLNGAKVTQQVLTNGDLVQVGSTKFRVEI